MTWNTDAQFASSVTRSAIYNTKQIDSFLESYDQFIIVASKGMGKTLLMRVKRDIIEKSDPSIILLPKNKTSDYVNLPATFSNDLKNCMEDATFWEDLWKLSISFSIFLNFPHNLSENEQKSIEYDLDRVFLPDQLRNDLRAASMGKYHDERAPSDILDLFLQMGKKNVEKARASALQVMNTFCSRYIRSACFVFIDSFDQALSKLFPGNLGIWCAAQNGLLKAAWELSRHNRHVKVYVSIRQEAYSSFSDSERNNMQGSIFLIEYTKDQLKEVFSKAIMNYEGNYSIEEFVGVKYIYNGYLKLKEKPFDYIYRHSIGVPRWLMIIGQELSALRASRKIALDVKERKKLQHRITEMINRVSASNLAFEHLRSEMRMFFGKVDPEIFMDEFLSKINSSVLSLSNLKSVLKRYIGNSVGLNLEHPFCLLYNLGLLGYVNFDATGVNLRQMFRKPYQYVWNHDQIIPINPNTYYLIHPSLHDLIQKKNCHFKYSNVCVGDGLKWTKTDDSKIKKEMIRIFISYAHEDWHIVEHIAGIIEEYLGEHIVLHDIWLDKWKMRSGKWIQDQIVSGITESDYLILIISKNSMGSKAVSVEWKTKFREKIEKGDDTVLPFVIDDTRSVSMPEYIKNIYYYRYEQDDDMIYRLVEDILFWNAERNK